MESTLSSSLRIFLDIKRFRELFFHLHVALSLYHSVFTLVRSLFETACCKPLLLLLFQAFDMCDWNHSLSSPAGAFKAQAWFSVRVFAWWKLWEIREWLCKANATRGGDVSVKTNTHLHEHSCFAELQWFSFNYLMYIFRKVMMYFTERKLLISSLLTQVSIQLSHWVFHFVCGPPMRSDGFPTVPFPYQPYTVRFWFIHS